MAAPSYLSTDFARYEDLYSVDVADVVTQVDTMLTATLPAASRWTSLGGGEYETPSLDPDGADHKMRVLVAKTAATRLQFHVKTPGGATVYNGEIDFTTSMSYRIWAGPYHLVIEFEYGTWPTAEVAWASLIDPTPLPHSSLGNYIACCMRRRNDTGATIGNNYHDEAIMNDGQGVREDLMSAYNPAVTTNMLSSSGSRIVLPCIMSRYATYRGQGKLFQMVMVDYNIDYRTTVIVPLDEGVTGEFEVLGKTIYGTYRCRMAVRRA